MGSSPATGGSEVVEVPATRIPECLERMGRDKTVPPLGLESHHPWWTAPGLCALELGDSICAHRGASFPRDWVRDLWVLAPAPRHISATRAFASHLFAGEVTQARWRARAPVDPRLESVWERYGVRPIEIDRHRQRVVVALDNPSLPPSSWLPWPRTVRVGRGISFAPARLSDAALIAEWSQRPDTHNALGYEHGFDEETLTAYLCPENARYHALLPVQIYTIRQHRRPVGMIFEYEWDYDHDSVREIDMAITEGKLPLRAFLNLLAATIDICFQRRASRVLVNIRAGLHQRGFPRTTRLFGAPDITEQIELRRPRRGDRAYYSVTAPQFYGSPVGQRFSPP